MKRYELVKISSGFFNMPDRVVVIPEGMHTWDFEVLRRNSEPTTWYNCELPEERISFDEENCMFLDGLMVIPRIRGNKLVLLSGLDFSTEMFSVGVRRQ